MLDFAAQYEAFQRRDPSFDGVVFVAVKTTGVYCRPVCPARTPFACNVRFYPSAAAAERGGFRPCLRCRPETAPFCPAWKGTQTTVERALNLIEQGALDRNGVTALAARLGIGPRHLSRLFADHLDASPLQIALSLRIQRANDCSTTPIRPSTKSHDARDFLIRDACAQHSCNSMAAHLRPCDRRGRHDA